MQRYYSMQVVDGYTFNIKTISPRVTNSWAADSYVIVGPSFSGSLPSRFDQDHIIRSSSRFTLVLGRTAVFGKEDIPNVEAIQRGYTLTPLQDNTGKKSKKAETTLPIFPLIDKEELAKASPEAQTFFTYANFISNYMRIEDFERDLFQRFRTIGVGPGMTFNGQEMSTQQYRAIQNGVTKGSKVISIAPLQEGFGNFKDGWAGFVDPPIFGTPEVLRGKYSTRAFAARIALYGNDPQEAYYPMASKDVNGDNLDSTQCRYTMTFPSGQLPPVKEGGFWSVTMYRLPERLFVHNPINRYSIGDRTEGLEYENGALTLYIQKNKPTAAAMAANWLPAPDPTFGGYESGDFCLYVRIYWPTKQALALPYLPPGVTKAGHANQ